MASKFLHIVRHGKSTWDYDNVSDIDRPLKERGITETHKMALRFKSNYALPDVLISSPAARAMHTAIIYARTLGFPFHQFQIEEFIYSSYEDRVLQMIKELENEAHSVVIFGHNPTFTDLANIFTRIISTTSLPMEEYPLNLIPMIGKRFINQMFGRATSIFQNRKSKFFILNKS
jgi:phosphohistidine phosphatase